MPASALVSAAPPSARAARMPPRSRFIDPGPCRPALTRTVPSKLGPSPARPDVLLPCPTRRLAAALVNTSPVNTPVNTLLEKLALMTGSMLATSAPLPAPACTMRVWCLSGSACSPATATWPPGAAAGQRASRCQP